VGTRKTENSLGKVVVIAGVFGCKYFLLMSLSLFLCPDYEKAGYFRTPKKFKAKEIEKMIGIFIIVIHESVDVSFF
jgi:hypothetical protein